jgi:hypothetical protein
MMNNPTSGFPPLTRRQLDLLEAIKAEKEKLKTLAPRDLKTGTRAPELYKIQERIDDLSVKALRSGLLRGLPAESRLQGSRLVVRALADSPGEYVVLVLPGSGDFHPELPQWAVNHFIEWIRLQTLQKEGRETLRETGIVGLETGIKRPIDFSDIERWELIKLRVLELRGVKDEDDDDMRAHLSHAELNEAPFQTVAEMLEEMRKRRIVTDEMLNKSRQHRKSRTEIKRKITKKNSASWNTVINKLVEEGLLPKKISHQAFKKALKSHFPDFPWDDA